MHILGDWLSMVQEGFLVTWNAWGEKKKSTHYGPNWWKADNPTRQIYRREFAAASKAHPTKQNHETLEPKKRHMESKLV